MGFSGVSVDIESACNAGDAVVEGWIPRLGRFPEWGHANQLQYSCLDNLINREAWRATVIGSQRVSEATDHVRMREGNRHPVETILQILNFDIFLG